MLSLFSLNIFILRGTPASFAIASRCSTLFEEHPSAISQTSAFLTDASFMISRAVIPRLNIFMTAMPAYLASLILSLITAGIVPFPGSAMPSASHRQFMLLAVYMPAHEPQEGQHPRSYSSILSSSIRLAFLAPTASKIFDRLISSPETLPAIIGPPEHTTVGMLRRTPPITMPGTILSQLGTSTSASSACARAIVSTLSAMSSRLASEYFMPTCPMAMPSHTPIAGMRMGVPPAAMTPSLTARASLSRCTCPGTISLCAEITPTSGRSSSSLVYPME